jgi:hypothetical protein
MTDEPESLVLRLLQQIHADVADIKTGHGNRLAAIEETLRLHGDRLDYHTAMFEELGSKMRELKDILRAAPSNAALARELRALEMRVAALEGRRQ